MGGACGLGVAQMPSGASSELNWRSEVLCRWCALFPCAMLSAAATPFSVKDILNLQAQGLVVDAASASATAVMEADYSPYAGGYLDESSSPNYTPTSLPPPNAYHQVTNHFWRKKNHFKTFGKFKF